MNILNSLYTCTADFVILSETIKRILMQSSILEVKNESVNNKICFWFKVRKLFSPEMKLGEGVIYEDRNVPYYTHH